ncbi:ATP-grasp domain-containing protein [Delftia acidovorans]|uniref:ATP-grasp domain-containing protein n=1 Tax=Delftia acidovorans TaxID=80866 RepID=UPI00192B2C07|nr:ATP-grasp domain-containing protein [Delftia acidovorans]
MPRILITAAGTGTAFGYAQAKARWFPEIALFTGDVNSAEEVTASLYAERHFVLPPSAADDYLHTVEGLLRQWAIDAYIPLIDSEVTQASILRDMLLARIACNGRDFSEAATAKSRYGEWLEVEGATALRPLARADVRDGVRLVAKRDGGFGGRATQIVESAQVAGALLQDGWSLYPYIEGDEFTVDCFPLNGRAVTSVRQRLEIKSGVCTKARIFHDETLASLALYLCQRFALTEPFCFQTRKADGLHYLIDINPRLGAGTAMSALNGTDFFAAHLACLSGRSPMEFLRPRFAECVVTRQYSEYLMNASL